MSAAHGVRAAPAPADVSYFEPGATKMVRGEGIWVYDEDGRRYADCAAGTFNLSLGYSHPEIVEAVTRQAEMLSFTSSTFQSDAANEVMRRLVEVSPPNLTRVHLKNTGGSTANEGAVKIAQHATGARDVITLFRSHLGQTIAMTSISGDASRRAPFPYNLPGGVQVPDPYCMRCFYRQKPDTCGFLCVERIADFIDHSSSGSVACMLVEPISGTGGNVVPPPGYFESLRRFCDERGIVLIFDEVQTGFGRTGHMFAADLFGVAPHMMTCAKGLGGSGFPIAAVLSEERLVGLERDFHGFTHAAQPFAAAAAARTLEIVSRPGFLENVRACGARAMQRLRALARRHRFIGDVRGAGLMIGVELVDRDGAPAPGLTNGVAARAFRNGVIVRTSQYGGGNVVNIRPPLIITPEEIDFVCDRLEAVLDRLP